MSTTNHGNPTDGAAEPTLAATTLIEILQELHQLGYAGQLIAAPTGLVRCAACQEESSAETVLVAGYRRLEGASDAADMNLVTWQCCPACGAGTTLILGYGPNASIEDVEVTNVLALGATKAPGSTPSEG